MTRRHPVSRSTAIVIGAAIRAARESRDWSAYALADQAGVSYNSVIGWESGRVAPELGTLLHLTEVLGLCSVDELLGGAIGTKVIRQAASLASVEHGWDLPGPRR